MGRPPKIRPESAHDAPVVVFETAEAPKKPEPDNSMFPVKLVKNYRPAGHFMVVAKEDLDDPYSAEIERKPTPEEKKKVREGSKIMLPRQEAASIIRKRIAERADEID